MEEVAAAKGEVVEMDGQTIRDLKVNQEARSCSILTTCLNQGASVYKSVAAKHHVQEDLRQETRIRSSEHPKDQMQVGKGLDSQIEEVKKVDFSALDYQPPPSFDAICITRSASPMFFPTSLMTSR